MKLRKPVGEAPQLCNAAGFTKSFDVELITPLYGGGVHASEPDTEMPIRAAAIRGQMRFWWRLLNRATYPNSRDLFRAERLIWGGLSNAGATASRVMVAVSGVTNVNKDQCAKYEQKNSGEWRTTPDFPHGPGYALFPGQGKADRNNGVTEPIHDVLLPGLTFTLRVEILQGFGNDKDAQNIWNDDVQPALRWWASFGGIGARTRRGVGSVKVGGLARVTEAEAKKIGCHLVCRAEKKKAQDAWTQSIEKLKVFRQGANVGRNPGTPPIPVGRSRWPEADSIRQITGCHLQTPAKTHAPVHPARVSFPRAAFGLPIITHFKDGPKHSIPPATRDPDDTTLYPVVGGAKQDRMASPLILKAMWTGTGFAPIALLLPYDHVRLMDLKLENNPGASNPSLPRDLPAGTWWPTATASTMTGSMSPNPLKGRSGDVLADFLTFFREN